MGISQNALARAIGVPPRRINEIVLGKRGITADTALRLSRAFGTSEGFWMGLQTDYGPEDTRKLIDDALRKVEKLAAQAACCLRRVDPNGGLSNWSGPMWRAPVGLWPTNSDSVNLRPARV